MKYCSQCGAQLVDEAVVCPQCGCPVQPQRSVDPNASPKSRLIALLLCIFVGGLGIHRFYVGKIGTGVLWLLTAGCFGIGALVDLIMIACGTFTDSDGKPVTDCRPERCTKKSLPGRMAGEFFAHFTGRSR